MSIDALILDLPNEVILLILLQLEHVDRCSFALACKHICRVAVQNHHSFNKDDVSFTARHRFMTLLSQNWVPPYLHFCFRCNRLREVDEALRTEWYRPSEPGNMTPELGPHCSRVDVTTGNWSVWKLMVKNEQRVVAWCPECVQKHTLFLQESERKRKATGEYFVPPCYGGGGGNDPTLYRRSRGVTHNVRTGLLSS